jgi:hypothetical protein
MLRASRKSVDAPYITMDGLASDEEQNLDECAGEVAAGEALEALARIKRRRGYRELDPLAR